MTRLPSATSWPGSPVLQAAICSGPYTCLTRGNIRQPHTDSIKPPIPCVLLCVRWKPQWISLAQQLQRSPFDFHPTTGDVQKASFWSFRPLTLETHQRRTLTFHQPNHHYRHTHGASHFWGSKLENFHPSAQSQAPSLSIMTHLYGPAVKWANLSN